MDELRRDLRHFARGALRRPGFTVAVLAILALGIASCAVVYSVVEALVLDPFPFPEPDRLVLVGSEMPAVGRDLGFFERLSGPEISEIAERSRTLRTLLPFDLNSVRVRGSEYPRRLFALFAWTDPFPTLGLAPSLGRGFSDEELRSGEAVVIVSHSLWQSLLGTDPGVLGRVLVVDGVSHTVIGVLPPASNLYGADLVLPMADELAHMPRERRQLNLLARVADGADLAAVDAELALLARGVETLHGTEHEAYRGWRLAVTPWTRFNAFAYRDAAILALGAVGFALLLVCVNLASLFLSRAAGERGAVAIRLALGASRGRILRRILVENGLYALAGGALGFLLARAGLTTLVSWLPPVLQPGGKAPELDGTVLLALIAASFLSALAWSAAPALHLLRTDPREAIAEAGNRGSGGRTTRRLHRGFVGAQVALAVILLAGGGSLLAGWLDVVEQEPGFDVETLVSMRLTLPAQQYDGAAVPVFFESLLEEVGAVPTVRSASIATQVAPTTLWGAELHRREDADDPGVARPRPFHTVVGDGYFDTLGLRLLRGRPLGPEDRAGSECAMVINELAAERFFPGRDPLRETARLKGSRFDSGWCRIVGIAESVRNRGLVQPAEPEVFTSHRQAGERFRQMYLVLRTAGDPSTILPAVRAAVQRLDPEQPVYDVTTGTEALARATATRRVTAVLVASFALVALLLTSVGIHGVVAYGVSRRLGEMSLRMALGGTSRQIARWLIRDALRPVLAGLAAGLVAAVALARVLRSALEPVASPSAAQLGAAALVLVLAAYLASALPARRARVVEPARLLRDL